MSETVRNDPLGKIKQRFDWNTKRVEDLVGIFDFLDNIPERDYKHTDVLRSAVVLLHASLEEVFRGMLEWRWPDAKGKNLDRLTFSFKLQNGDDKESPNMSMAQLGEHSDKQVRDVIEDSVKRFLKESNFNNAREIGWVLGVLSVHRAKYKAWIGVINDAILRRHDIVHRADRNAKGNTVSIKSAEVAAWLKATRSFVNQLCKDIGEQDKPMEKRKLRPLKSAPKH